MRQTNDGGSCGSAQHSYGSVETRPSASAPLVPSEPDEPDEPDANAEHALPPVTHRGVRVAQMLARATELPIALVDLGDEAGPVVHARDAEEGERFAALWRRPGRPGVEFLSDPLSGEALGLAVTMPLALSGRSGWAAAIDPGSGPVLPRHHALLELLAELCIDREGERTANGLWIERVQSEADQIERLHALSGIGSLSCEFARGEVEVSRRAMEILGRPLEGVPGLVEIAAPADRHALNRFLAGSGEAEHITLACTTAGGGTARVRLARLVEDGIHTGLIGTVQDISADHCQIEQLRRLVVCDSVTGVGNRYSLEQTMAGLTHEGPARSEAVGLLLVAIGGLGELVRHLGPSVGDLLLRFVADTLKGASGPADEVARIDSAEFAVVLRQAKSEAELLDRAETIHRALKTSIAVGIHRIDVDATAALALYPHDTVDGLDLLHAASYALHDSSQAASPLVRRYRPEIRARHEGERRLIADVTHALRRNEFQPFFQPKVDLETGRIVGFEALCRWCHPRRGVLTPGAFHAALVSNAVSAELSDVALVGSFRAAGRWRELGLDFGHIAINLSATQLARANLVDMVEDLERRFTIHPKDITFEVLENVLISDATTARNNLHALGRAGFTIALDDFGTGFASLAHLREPCIRELKIDRSFVTDAGSNARDQRIVGAIVQLANRLGLTLVAEGIEDEETLRKLRAMGCPTGQGFVFAPALPFEEATEFLGRQHRIYKMIGSLA